MHRIGQQRPVNVVRFVIEVPWRCRRRGRPSHVLTSAIDLVRIAGSLQASVEQRVVNLQEKKRRLMEQAFGKGTTASREQRVEDLKMLFA